VKVDLRVVAAANRDLEAMVRRGAFREDLFYRLNVLRVEMPPLAARPEDVPPLAEHLLVEIALAQGAPALGFTEAALKALAAYRWPGNVRELRNAVERAFVSARGRRIDVADLPPAVRQPVAVTAPAREDGAVATEGVAGLSLAEVEKAHIERVLAMTGWNRSMAARLLGIDRRTLFAKIQRHGLVGPLRPGPGPAPDPDPDDDLNVG
jgi:two-component system, NtrC family, response regulator AtoC